MNAPTLFVIAADLTRMQVIASIDEADVGRMRPGQTVTFRVDAFPADRFTGTVSQVRLQPAVVQNVVTYSTVISVPNPELKLKPGMTAQVSIEIARRNNVLRIPNSATRFRPTAEMFTVLNQPVPPELERGPGGPGGAREGGRAAGAAPAERVAGAVAPAATAPRRVPSGATTIDSLFAPLQTRETRGVAWHYDDKQLKIVRLRLGVSDGTLTEVLNEEDLPDGAALVVSMTTTGREQRPATASTQGNPLMGPQRGGPGGFGGGGGRGGG
jgi:HlyD family secretion protein